MSTITGAPTAQPDPARLSMAEVLENKSIQRIKEVLNGPSWGWLTRTVRAAWEHDLSRQRIRVDLSALSDAETAAMADFLRWPTHRIGTVTVSLARLDALLRASGLSAGLAACLTAAGGPLRDEAGRRRADKAAQRAASDQVWAEAARHPALMLHPTLEVWLADEHRAGRVPADVPVRRQVLLDALAVLATLPDPGTGLAQLANRVLGQAHALDEGPVPATVLRALAWLCGQRQVPLGSAGRRALWASAGVALDTVSSTVLVLGLALPGSGPIVTTLKANAAAGLPARLTLGQIRHYLETEGAAVSGTPPTVFICENPSVIEAAADQLGVGSAPLACVEGRPSVAAGLLLETLQHAGSVLYYHGDFDWPGLAIAHPLIEAGALPWRLGAADYRNGLARCRRLKRLPPPGRPVETPWDRDLAATMMNHRIAVEEEAVIDCLLSDLALRS